MRVTRSPVRIAPPVKGREGAVLVMSLLLLAMITILGVYSSTRTAMEEKVAGAAISATRVFYVAEAALSHGRKLVNDQVAAVNGATNWDDALGGTLFPPAATSYYCDPNGDGCPDTASLVSGAWTNQGTLVLDNVTTTVAGITYTYSVFLYNNDDTGGAVTDADGLVILRSIARAWSGSTLLSESIQEETLAFIPGGTLAADSGTRDAGGDDNASAANGGSPVNLGGGGQVM